jgi:hypothetical protein
VIDAGDAVWSSLRVWRDVDADGFSDGGELFALSALGVSAIDLGFTATGTGDGLGNTQQRAGGFTRSDGSSGTIGEYLLARNATINIAESTVIIGGCRGMRQCAAPATSRPAPGDGTRRRVEGPGGCFRAGGR